MKKKLALAMAGIMTVAMVPATAFAATKVTAVDEITTGVDDIFTSRVELKNDNDQSDIVTDDGTFDVYATLTNGKFAREGDDDDNDYQMDTATYNWEESGIVDVDVVSDTKAKVTLKASVFNQSDDDYSDDWKADWIATHADDIENYWKETDDAKDAAEALWVADTDDSATAIQDKWVEENQDAVEAKWKEDNAYTSYTEVTDVDIQTAAMNAWLDDNTDKLEADWNGLADDNADKLSYSTDAAWDAAVASSDSTVTTAETDAYDAAVASSDSDVQATITTAQDDAWAEVSDTDQDQYFVDAYGALNDEAKAAVADAAATAAHTTADPEDVSACVLPIIAKAVDTGDVVVKFTSNVSAFKTASEVIAKAVDGDAEIEIEGIKTFVEDGDEEDTLKEITINELTPATLQGNDIELKLKGNWDFVDHDPTISFLNQTLVKGSDEDYTIDVDVDDNEITIKFTTEGANKLKNDDMLTKMTISDIKIETTKKCDPGDVATITVSSDDLDTQKLEVAKMVEEAVTYSIEDDDLPTIWAGKNYAKDMDSNTLKLSVEENQGDILNTSRKATFTFPEGIEVVDIADEKGLTGDEFKYEIDENVVTIRNYQKGATESSDNETDFSLKFILNAAPTFSGDVDVTLGGQFDDVTFTVATVKAPYTVEAKTSEVLIDYRYVPVNEIVITEAEDGILDDDDKIILAVEKMDFEDAGDIEVTDGDIDVDVDIDDDYNDNDYAYLIVTVDDASTEASTMVISGLELYLDRTLPVGGYALQNVNPEFDDYNDKEDNYEPINILWENSTLIKESNSCDDDLAYDFTPDADNKSNGLFKYDELTVNDEYVNVITAARDRDDSMTTKKIVITVGATTMAAGTETVTLDAPAYINAENYTMLPLRAISEAFGGTVNWDDTTKTVTILSGQRIISMTIGSRTMYINGTPVAMNTAPEITADRTFVPVRDLSNSLGISDINWTEASGTVTLN